MIEKLFPGSIDNRYRGKSVAKWLFAAVTVLTVVRSLVHMFFPDGGAQSIAGIPLDAFSPDAASVVIGLFAYWGLSQLLLGLFFTVVLWRYQSLIPLMWLFVFLEWSGRLLLGLYKPIETLHVPPGAVGNYVLPVLALTMLALSALPGKTNEST